MAKQYKKLRNTTSTIAAPKAIVPKVDPSVSNAKRQKEEESLLMMMMMMDNGDENQGPVKKSKAPIIIMFLIIVLILGGIAIWYFFFREDDSGDSSDSSDSSDSGLGQQPDIIDSDDCGYAICEDNFSMSSKDHDPESYWTSNQRAKCCKESCEKMCALRKKLGGDPDSPQHDLCELMEDTNITNCQFHCQKYPEVVARFEDTIEDLGPESGIEPEKRPSTLLEMNTKKNGQCGPNHGKKRCIDDEYCTKLGQCSSDIKDKYYEYSTYSGPATIYYKNCVEYSRIPSFAYDIHDKASIQPVDKVVWALDYYFRIKPKIFFAPYKFDISGSYIDYDISYSNIRDTGHDYSLKAGSGCKINSMGIKRIAVEETSEHEVGDIPEVKNIHEGTKEKRLKIKFVEPFYEKPKVMLSIVSLRSDNSKNTRIQVSADKITNTGFEFVAKTWGDSIIERVRCQYIASTILEVGEHGDADLREDEIEAGVDDMEVGIAEIKDKSGELSKDPPKENDKLKNEGIRTATGSVKLNFFTENLDLSIFNVDVETNLGEIVAHTMVTPARLDIHKGHFRLELTAKQSIDKRSLNLQAKTWDYSKLYGPMNISWLALVSSNDYTILGNLNF
jgi:hypothetical protein